MRTADDMRADLERIARVQAAIDGTPAVLAQQAVAEARVAKVAESQVSPDPLRRPVPPAQPYPLAALGEVLAPAVIAMHRVIQAPDAVCASGVLAGASLATQAHADVEVDGRVMPLSLWLLSVAESGERKSACDTEAMRAAHEYQRELAVRHADQLIDHAADLAEHEARKEAAKLGAKKAQGRGLAEALREIGPPPPAPLLPRVTVADFTSEGLFRLLAAGQPSVGAMTDEASLVFGGHGMTDEAVARTAGTLCRLWDRGELDRVRVADGAQQIHGRRLAMHLLAQPVIAMQALSHDVLAGQGFLARCLLAWPQGTAGARPYVAEALRDDASLRALQERLLQLHRMPLPLVEGDRQMLAPRRLHLASPAKALWVKLHDGIERGMAESGTYAAVKPWASKTSEQALRIAGVLALIADPDAQQIDAETMGRAAELAVWHLGEAVRLIGTAEVSAAIQDAEALLAWCHATGRTLLYTRVALQFGPARLRDRDSLLAAIDTLIEAGWAVPFEGSMEIDGARRRQAWAIVAADGTRPRLPARERGLVT